MSISDLEIMGDMIKDQTKQIKSMIDDQTDILLAAHQAAIDNNNAQTQILRNEIRGTARELKLEFTNQLLDDMQG